MVVPASTLTRINGMWRFNGDRVPEKEAVT
jgi:hypothetical protein